ncbi:hypothetical protein AWW67_15095 [Roseivirga seohaensis]|uniref:DUF4221 domain-containing protein n=1 Tax=Roseivirga seohaensis TaxID=1914963 RepID=A0A150Y3L0_9BACT|nr:hypothetical protein AWW67_15095 [Roseivirga seohaensis]
MCKHLLILFLLIVSEFVGDARQYIREVDVDFPFKVIKGDSMTFELDERTVHPWAPGSCFQYLSSEDAVAYLNKIDASIKLFDVKSGTIVLSVPLSIEGPDSVGPEPVSFYWVNRDSIFVFSNLNNGRLSLLNSKGEKYRNYELNSTSDELAHTVELKRISGGISYSKQMNALFLGLRVYSPQKMLKRAPYLKLDIASGKLDYFTNPQPYAKSDLGKIPFDHRFGSTAVFYNDLSNELILDFALSPDLWVKRDSDKWLIFRAQSVYYEKPLFLKSELTKYKNNRRKYIDEVRLMPRYSALVYDQYRDVYYRIGRLPFNRELSKRRDMGEELKIYQEFSIQAFDKDFKKIAENKFFDENLLFEQGLFVNEEGLWLLRPQGEDEDVMEFKLMKILKK